jgi:hypothetical protein
MTDLIKKKSLTSDNNENFSWNQSNERGNFLVFESYKSFRKCADGFIEFQRWKLKFYIWLSVKGPHTKGRSTFSFEPEISLEKGLNALKGFCVLRQNYQSINDINCMLNSVFPLLCPPASSTTHTVEIFELNAWEKGWDT